MTDRQRIRRGRTVSYTPTAAEATANGAGPYLAMITDVNADGTVDLLVDVPGFAAIAAVTEPDADATYGQPEADLINELKVLVDLLVVDANARVKTSVTRGAQAGQFSLLGAGSDAL